MPNHQTHSTIQVYLAEYFKLKFLRNQHTSVISRAFRQITNTFQQTIVDYKLLKNIFKNLGA